MSTRKPTDLERLTQPGGKVLPDDATIPVLTERLTLPSLELDISLPQPPPPVVAPPTPTAAPAPPPPPSPPPPAPATSPAPKPTAPRATASEDAGGPSTIPADGPATIPADGPPTVPATELARSGPPTIAMEEPATAALTPPIQINWAHAEARVREALLRELQPRLAADIDRQLRERLQPTVVRMLLATITELRPAIDAAIRDVVERAVTAEIGRQRDGKR